MCLRYLWILLNPAGLTICWYYSPHFHPIPSASFRLRYEIHKTVIAFNLLAAQCS